MNRNTKRETDAAGRNWLVITQTLNNWKPEVGSLLHKLTKAGCKLIAGNNGDEDFKAEDMTLAKFIENLIACDEAHLYVQTPAGKRRWVYLVLGNSPGELVCDYTCDDVLDAVTDAHYTQWESRKQPTRLDVQRLQTN